MKCTGSARTSGAFLLAHQGIYGQWDAFDLTLGHYRFPDKSLKAADNDGAAPYLELLAANDQSVAGAHRISKAHVLHAAKSHYFRLAQQVVLMRKIAAHLR